MRTSEQPHTGEGIVSAIGLDKQSVLRSLQERRAGIGCMRFLRSAHTELPVAEVPLAKWAGVALIMAGCCLIAK